MRPPSQPVSQGLSHTDAAADNDHVDVVAGSLKKQVSYIAANNIAFTS